MIVFFHLLNDRSGSPRALVNAMTALAKRDPDQRLYLGQGGDGFLSEYANVQSVQKVDLRRYPYQRGNNKWATLRAYLLSQWHLWRALRRAGNDVDAKMDAKAICYVNTLLPFAGAIFGKLSSRPVVYHLHEASLKPRLLQWFLLQVVRRTAERIICVSDYHRRALELPDAQVVHNAIARPMFERGQRAVYSPRHEGVFRVCMLCSLRDYKGVPEFVRLAETFAADDSVQFQLVVSEDAAAIRHYFTGKALPQSMQVVQGGEDVSSVYESASLVLNLSRVDQAVETFGLTVLEAMTFGVPVIAPPVGGPTELVSDGLEGFLVDSRDIERLRERVAQLVDSESLCQQMSLACRIKAQELSPDRFDAAIRAAVFGDV